MRMTKKIAVTTISTAAVAVAVGVGTAVVAGTPVHPAKAAQHSQGRVIEQFTNDDGSVQTVTTPDNYVAPAQPEQTTNTDPTADQPTPVPAATPPAPIIYRADSKPVSTTEVPIQFGN